MRTTLTLDDDLARKLHALAEQRRLPFKQVVNLALRRGLGAGRGRAPEPFIVDSFASAFRPGIDPGRLNQLADELDLPAQAKKARR